MLKNLALIILAVAFLASCAGDTSDQAAGSDDVAELTIAQLNTEAAHYAGKLVKVTGTVDHVCQHGGKRMFLMGADPSDRIKVECGDQPPFKPEYEGSDFTVTGTLIELRVDEDYLNNMAAEIQAEEHEACPAEQQSQDATQQAEHDDHADHDDPLAQVKALRAKLSESGQDFLGYYHIECATAREVKTQ